MPEVSLLPFPSEESAGLTPQLLQVPVIAQALFFLREAHPEKGIKLTVDQCISKSFVQKFWTAQIQPFYPNSRKPVKHEDSMELTKISFLLEEAGFIRIRGDAVRTSPAGEVAIEMAHLVYLYQVLLKIYLKSWNWACEDDYPEFEFVQDNAVDLMSALARWPFESVSPRAFFKTQFKAGTDDLAIYTLKARFFDRFAVLFGLLERPTQEGSEFTIDRAYRKTTLLLGGPSVEALH